MDVLSSLQTQSDTSALSAKAVSARALAAKNSKTTNREEISQVAQDFESMFLSQMFQCMFEGMEADPVFGGGKAESMYRSLMVDEYGKQVSKHGGVGIAEAVSRTLLAAQEGRA
ncbi:MAG: rod-binding protein [Rhodospirillaceae bacterium]|nr:rod-binding protein [Rhodospirillaceae bacterium]